MGRAVKDLVQGLDQQRLRGDNNLPSPTKRNFVTRKPSADSSASEHKSNDSVSAPSDVTHDSMVTVPLSGPPSGPLSGPPSLSIETNAASSQSPMPSSSLARTVETIDQTPEPDAAAQDKGNTAVENPEENDGGTPKEEGRTLEDELQDCERDSDAPGTREQDTPTPRSRDSEDSVNWDELQKTEHEHKERRSDTSTHLLLARLDQENAKPTSPKSPRAIALEREGQPRPPTMGQLKKMVTSPTPQALRYSMLPPPPMTDLEFFAALVKDYQQTAERLPTLLSNKIRKGIPPPLRGVVWQSMSGARDAALEEQYEKVSNESSPYEFIISKDLARSFPGVDMFREPGGEGQRMLAKVLKSFSIYDREIGYCQGLAFLVGPLLMHMPDKAAFCVLVRLMEGYDLRSCFQPDLAGLHLRIYQFRELLRHTLPALSTHLDDLQVEPAYVSQWFLSFFAVTCPLPMLFRIYDILLAEGATETFMRVGLALLRRNEAKLQACTELEDAMQILLSRSIWDPYNFDADAFVQDVTALTPKVSGERLQELERSYKESKRTGAPTLAAPAARDGSAGGSRASDVINTAASRFLGRNVPAPKPALSPGLNPPSTPVDMLMRSNSKRSVASTLNSMEASSASVTSSTSTEATSVSRDSSDGNGDQSSPKGNTVIANSNRSGSTVASNSTERPNLSRIPSARNNAGEKNLHGQIEDLLTALSELQRNQALLASQLKQERHERAEDKEVVRSLVRSLAQNGRVSDGDTDTKALLQTVEERFGVRADETEVPLTLPTKAQLNEDLAQTREKLAAAQAESQQYSKRIYEMDQELTTLKKSLREGHAHVRSLLQDKQRLEKQVHAMRNRNPASNPASLSVEKQEQAEPAKVAVTSGLREFKLGRAETAPQFTKRSSSLRDMDATPGEEALLRELVQAKTAEAMARQEADELRGKLEALRKAHGLGPESGQGISLSAAGAGAAAMGLFGKLTEATGASASSGAGASGGGGFWGWRR